MGILQVGERGEKKKRDSSGNYSRFLFRKRKTEEVAFAVAVAVAVAMPIWLLLLLRSIQIF